MLSMPPCALAQSTRASASVSGSGGVGASFVHQRLQVGGLGAVVPQAVRADQHPSGREEVQRGRVRHVVGGVRPEPPRDRVRLRSGLGLGAGDAVGDLLRGVGVVDGEQLRLPGLGDPVGTAVADPADDEQGGVHDRGDEGARGRVARVGGRTGDGARHDGVVGRVRGRLECLRGGGDPGAGGPDPARGRAGEDVTSRPGGRQAGDVGVDRVRHPVADHQDGMAAGLGTGVQRDRVLVAVVAHTPVARGGHPARRLLGEVVARAAGLRPALGAVAVVGDHAAALVAVRRARLLGQRWRRVRRRALRSAARVAGRGCFGRRLGGRQLGAARLAVALTGPDRRRARRARHRAREPGRALARGPGHRSVHRRTAFARSTSATRSSRVRREAREVPVGRLQPVPQVRLGGRATRDGDRGVRSLRLHDVERRGQHVHPEAGPVDRVDGQVVDARHRGGQGRQAATRLGQEAGPAPPGRGERAAGHGHQVERADSALDVPAAGADPGQAEGGGGDVGGVGAGAGDVQRLGHVDLATGLAGERQGQLRRELARDLAVDRVERALCVAGPAAGQGDEPGHPGSAPLPGVVDQQLLRGAVGPVEVARLERGARPGQEHLGADLGCGRQGLETLVRVVDAERAQPGRLGVALVDPELGQVLPVEPVVGDGGRPEQQRGHRVLGRALATPRHHLAEHAEQLHPELVGGDEPVGRIGSAGLEQQPVERVVRLEERASGRPAAARRCRCSGSPGTPSRARSACARSCRCPRRPTGRRPAPRGPGSRWCRRSPSRGRRGGVRRRGRSA